MAVNNGVPGSLCAMHVGQAARRSRTITARDIELFTEMTAITAETAVLDMRDDKPICTLRTTITNQDGTVVLDGTALVYREQLS